MCVLTYFTVRKTLYSFIKVMTNEKKKELKSKMNTITTTLASVLASALKLWFETSECIPLSLSNH